MQIMKSFLLLFALTISLALNAQTNKAQSSGVSKSAIRVKTNEASYSYTIIPSENKTWGYDILMEKRLYIHQPNAPGLPGNKGFKTKAIAEKVARLVIEKIKKGEMPPTVTIEEMKRLKVL
jgi:hypothetical protein